MPSEYIHMCVFMYNFDNNAEITSFPIHTQLFLKGSGSLIVFMSYCSVRSKWWPWAYRKWNEGWGEMGGLRGNGIIEERDGDIGRRDDWVRGKRENNRTYE